MRISPILLLLTVTSSANAEIFKCTDKFGQARYQAKPCQESSSGKQLTLKSDSPKQRDEKSGTGGALPNAPGPQVSGPGGQIQQGVIPPIQPIPVVSP